MLSAIDPRACASASFAALLIIAGAIVSQQKDRFAANGQDPVPLPGAEFDFDLTYQDDIDAGSRAKCRLVAQKLQSMILAIAAASAISALSAAVPDYAVAAIIFGFVVILAQALCAWWSYRIGAKYIDASTQYVIFYQRAKYLGVRTIRQKFSEEFPQQAKVLKPEWDRDTTYYPDLQGGPESVSSIPKDDVHDDLVQ